MRILYSVPPPLKDVELIAWHNMLNDPHLSTYTMHQTSNGTWYEKRRWVNPKLAWRRSIDDLAMGMQRFANTIQEALFGPMTEFAEAMDSLYKSINQSPLRYILADEDKVK